jgi:hypothetical protein
LHDPDYLRAGATDGRAWLRLGLAVAALAALARSALANVQGDPLADVSSFGQVISTDRQDGWTGGTPSWRSRSQILKDAGVSR